MESLVIAVAQLNPIVGDVSGNLEKVRKARDTATRKGANLLLLSELFIGGYPPDDLVLRRSFQIACREAIHFLADETADGGAAVLIGTPWREAGNLYNSYCLLDGGQVSAVRHKVTLPDYGSFGETRLFCPGTLPAPVSFRGVFLGLPVCEDIWSGRVVSILAEQGAEILLVPNASPFERGKSRARRRIAEARVKEAGIPLLYVNQVGGQDELVFDGASFALNPNPLHSHSSDCLAFQMPAFTDALDISVWNRLSNGWVCQDGPKCAYPGKEEATYMACVVGLRDYVEKTGFSNVLLGLSGGLDSALCATIAVDALGPERVHCLMLSSQFTSDDSVTDAAVSAYALGVNYETMPIDMAVLAFENLLAPFFKGFERNETEENIQSRVRGTILMAISNKFGSMLINTSNKSELAVGYATLYGDMNGGYSPLKDLYKTDVFSLAHWRNVNRPFHTLGPDGGVIPDRSISKPPSAELREGQRDDESLPAYDVLDPVLHGLIEEGASVRELLSRGYDRTVVLWVENALHTSEYKRFQSPPGPRISSNHLSRDRRYPIVNSFRDGGLS